MAEESDGEEEDSTNVAGVQKQKKANGFAAVKPVFANPFSGDDSNGETARGCDLRAR